MPASPALLQAVDRHLREVTRATLPVPSARRLALLVTGLITAQSCVLRRVAAGLDALAATGALLPEHVERRLRRALADPRLTAANAWQAAARAVLTEATLRPDGGPLIIAVDDSSQDARVHLLRAALSYWGGSLPLAWVTWEQNVAQPRGHYWRQIDQVLADLAALLPPGVPVVLVADRAFDVPAFTDRVAAHGWHWAVRAKANSQLRFRDPRGREQPLRTVLARSLPGPGSRWKGRGQIFKKAGWRDASVVAVWASGAAEPLVVLTDQPPRWPVLTHYDGRFWIEAGFRADKSAGWQWEASRVPGCARQARLLLALAWATLVMLCLGLAEARARLAALAHPPTTRPAPKPQPARDSLFRLGLRAAQRGLLRATALSLCWDLPEPGPRSWAKRWWAAQGRRYILCHTVRL